MELSEGQVSQGVCTELAIRELRAPNVKTTSKGISLAVVRPFVRSRYEKRLITDALF